MKRFNFLLVAIAIVLTVTAVSCTTMAGTQDDYYSGRDAQVYGNRVYVDDPYRGTVVLERDPRTGRYYEVSSPYYDSYYGNRRVYGSRVYSGSTYGRNPYYGRSNGGYYRNNNNSNYSNNSEKQNNQRSTEEYKKDRDDARKKVLGN